MNIKIALAPNDLLSVLNQGQAVTPSVDDPRVLFATGLGCFDLTVENILFIDGEWVASISAEKKADDEPPSEEFSVSIPGDPDHEESFIRVR